MSSDRMSVRETRQTARSLEKSLESANQGLNALLQSLEQGHFREAADSYRQMQIVLIQQWLWSRAYRRDELETAWQAIQHTARSIVELLTALSSAIEPLAHLDTIELSESPTPAQETSSPPLSPVALELLETILGQASLSFAKLADHFPDPSEERDYYLEQLIAANILEQNSRGRTPKVRLSPALRQQIAAELVKSLPADP